MGRLVIGYLMCGIVFMLVYCISKKEERIPVMLATITGWPLFLISMIGAGWNILLTQEEKDQEG